jgi:hypothetical protein
LSGDAEFVFGQRNVPAPDLKYLILPPYEVPDLIIIGGVVVENRGNAPAHNVKIVLEYETTDANRIRHLQVVSDVEYIVRGGGELQTFANLRVRQLDPGKKLVIYYSGTSAVQPRVIVTHYEGAA